MRTLLRKYNPNGYIYGVGAGAILATVGAFPYDPKGLIMVDIDPAVVLGAKVMRASSGKHSCKV